MLDLHFVKVLVRARPSREYWGVVDLRLVGVRRHARPSFCWSARRHLRHCSQRTSTTPGHAVRLSKAAVLLMWRCW